LKKAAKREKVEGSEGRKYSYLRAISKIFSLFGGKNGHIRRKIQYIYKKIGDNRCIIEWKLLPLQ
jgi:hypothetical protein